MPAVAAVLAAVALAGCGGGGPSRSEFEESIQDTRNRVAVAVQRVTESRSKEQMLDRLDEASDTIDAAAADLEEAGAAEGFEDESDRLVKSLDQLAADLEGIAAEFRQPAFADVLLHTRALRFESWTRANRILRDLRRQGIDVEPWA